MIFPHILIFFLIFFLNIKSILKSIIKSCGKSFYANVHVIISTIEFKSTYLKYK